MNIHIYLMKHKHTTNTYETQCNTDKEKQGTELTHIHTYIHTNIVTSNASKVRPSNSKERNKK